MKRIRNIEQLRSEQLRLTRERIRLEGNIRKDWDGLRHDFDPAEYSRELFFSGLQWLTRRIFSKQEHKDSSFRPGRKFFRSKK